MTVSVKRQGETIQLYCSDTIQTNISARYLSQQQLALMCIFLPA